MLLAFLPTQSYVLVLCVGGVLVGFSVGLESARPICRLASSSDCAIDRVSRWAVSVPCTLGTEWVIVSIVGCTLGTGGVVRTGVANDLLMAGCWWMACSVSSTSYHISSAPLGLVMSLIAFAQSAITFMTLGDGWSRDVFVTEVDCVQDPFTFGCFNVTSVCVIMFGGS